MPQRHEITVETEETLTIRDGGSRRAYCERCCEWVCMTSPATIAMQNGISERHVFRLIESGLLDCLDIDRTLVCPQCVAKSNIEINKE